MEGKKENKITQKVNIDDLLQYCWLSGFKCTKYELLGLDVANLIEPFIGYKELPKRYIRINGNKHIARGMMKINPKLIHTEYIYERNKKRADLVVSEDEISWQKSNIQPDIQKQIIYFEYVKPISFIGFPDPINLKPGNIEDIFGRLF